MALDGLRTLGLFVATALAEIVGCYLPYLWLKQGRSAWLLVPAAASLALFACGSFRYEADFIAFDRREMNYLLDGVVDDVRKFTFGYLLVIHVKFVG